MTLTFTQRQIALAALAALGSAALTIAPTVASAGKTAGKYVAGDFHNHTTCSDGAISMQKLVNKATATWGLDWFVQAGHGGNGNRNCTLVEDDSLATPAYPTVRKADGTVMGPTTTWADSIGTAAVKGTLSGTAANPNMWRWQSIQEFQYPLLEYLSVNKNVPLFMGMESVVAGHEHGSMSVVTGQMPSSIDSANSNVSKYNALGNANALAQWSYCFDRNDTDTSRGTASNNWNCAVNGSLNAGDASWNATAQKLMPAGGTGTGNRGHLKTVEGIKWMAQNHPGASYYVPAHLERAGPFNPDGNNGFNVEHLRNFNNAGPAIAFGFETQPGHGASSERGEYFPGRNNIGGTIVDSVGGTTWGGTGIYGAAVGGVWDALLGEGRNFWFFASSDWHNRGVFGPDDRRSTQDFQPGEYQRNYTLVRNGADKIRPQAVVDGLRTGNNWAASGQLIDRLAFIACASYAGPGARSTAAVEALALAAANGNTDIDSTGCATMGEKLKVRPGAEVVVSIVVRDPSGTNNAPYSFPNPSLLQVGTSVPINTPVLDHVDVIRGEVTGYKQPGASDYAGEWPRTWLVNPDLATVPAAAKNTSAAVLKTFNKTGWTSAGGDLLKMSFRVPAVQASQYLRLRGSNLPAAVPFETDANGNPLADVHTNATTTVTDTAATVSKPATAGSLKIRCTTSGGSNVPANGVLYAAGSAPIDACPNHLPVVAGVKYVAYDVAAWSDLWFYSNPIYIEVAGGTAVAGVK